MYVWGTVQSFQCGDRLYTSQSDVYRRQIVAYIYIIKYIGRRRLANITTTFCQILTSKADPRFVGLRMEIFIIARDP